MVKNLLANAKDVRNAGLIPGLGTSLGEGMATHSSILAWRIPMDRGTYLGGCSPWDTTELGHD